VRCRLARLLVGTLGGSAAAVSERGQIVGQADTRKDTYAFLWQNGKMRDPGTLGGRDSQAWVNERGQIRRGRDSTVKDNDGHPIPHAFLWHNGKMRDLPIRRAAESGH
jgi:probable HAF family extracellular repeat protein